MLCRTLDHVDKSSISLDDASMATHGFHLQPMARIHLGHTYLTHSHLLNGNRENQPEYVGCACPLTVHHVMIDCVEFAYNEAVFPMSET